MKLPQHLRIRDDALHRPVGDEVVVLDLDSREIHGLEGVGAFVWERLGDEPTMEELTAAVVERYRVDAERAAADLERFVGELVEAGLVERT
ncbi:MAG TPA: PqqD family protein [Thermoanaerobaculia bacterium]|nr:PqqD family protein [Thermoanaerobaculia bacterium]